MCCDNIACTIVELLHLCHTKGMKELGKILTPQEVKATK